MRISDWSSDVCSSDLFDDWAFLSRGDAFLELGEAERALADYGQVIELEPENPAGYSHRSDALLDLGRRDEALADIEIALRLDPDISDNYVRRGIVLVDQGRYTLAEIDFEERSEEHTSELQSLMRISYA